MCYPDLLISHDLIQLYISLLPKGIYILMTPYGKILIGYDFVVYYLEMSR